MTAYFGVSRWAAWLSQARRSMYVFRSQRVVPKWRASRAFLARPLWRLSDGGFVTRPLRLSPAEGAGCA